MLKKTYLNIPIVILIFGLLVVPLWAQNQTNEPVSIGWLGGEAPAVASGVSWGVPWQRGIIQKNTEFTLTTTDGKVLPLQTWAMAYWPDGTLKWSGFAAVVEANDIESFKLTIGSESVTSGTPVKVIENKQSIEIDTGKLKCRIPRNGSSLVDTMEVDGRIVARDGRLVCVLQQGMDKDVYDTPPTREKFLCDINKVTVEQNGPVRVVVRIQGMHNSGQGSRQWLPFDVRLYFYAGQTQVRMVHTIVFDGNQEKDFIRGLGIVFSVPMREQMLNRHVRFSGQNNGLWAEPIKPLAGRGRFGNRNAYVDQVEGKRLPDMEQLNRREQSLINDLAVWTDYKLVQNNADGFYIQKRTNEQSCWLNAGAGKRSTGMAFVGDVSGGLAVGVKDFWQSYPSSLEIRNAASDMAELRIWFWSPDAQAMDMRHYDIVAHGLAASYEDVQPGFSIATGVARTSEIMLYPCGDVPSKADLAKMAKISSNPPLLVCTPEYLHSVGAFGIWSLPDRSTPTKQTIEDELDATISQYQKEIEQRYWYGFWDYGDVMHSYDSTRHVWRYDIGGYAWDNSELVPDMWLWYSFLRTGREDIFRMAEAMTRHTGEVDCYHLGRFAGLGSRHNVRHWGCGAKELRISQAPLRRFYYYLTTDERTGDLMHAVADADYALLEVDPMRIALPISKQPTQQPTRARVGPDWLAMVGNWMTEWERTGNVKYRDKILTGIDSIAQMPYGFFSGPGVLGYNPETGKLYNEGPDDSRYTSHLIMIMGGAEVCFELSELIESENWDKIWMQYCELYSQEKDGVGGGSYPNWHARLTAYAAKTKGDSNQAQKAWRDFLGRGMRRSRFTPQRIEGPDVLNPIEEVRSISTNDTAQRCLNAIELLELIGDQIPDENP